MESNIVMRINESKEKKMVKTGLNLVMMAAAISVAIIMEEFKVQRLLYWGGPLMQAHGSRKKNSIKSNQTICEYLEENEVAGNYRLGFAMSLRSNLILFVNDQEVWVGEEAAGTIYPASTRLFFFFLMLPCTTPSKGS